MSDQTRTDQQPSEPEFPTSEEGLPTSADEWRQRLDPKRYEVLREGGTEQAFTGAYWNDHRDGVYRCGGCGAELFSSDTKFESGSGWPSFWEPMNDDRVITRSDNAFGMRRTEVLCATCEGHLGHVFDDGPNPTGLRYCINSASLDLETDQGPTAD